MKSIIEKHKKPCLHVDTEIAATQLHWTATGENRSYRRSNLRRTALCGWLTMVMPFMSGCSVLNPYVRADRLGNVSNDAFPPPGTKGAPSGPFAGDAESAIEAANEQR